MIIEVYRELEGGLFIFNYLEYQQVILYAGIVSGTSHKLFNLIHVILNILCPHNS